MSGKTDTFLPPLTSTDQEDVLYKLAGKKFVNKGAFFAATAEFYNHLGNDVDLLTAAKDLYRWLGVKPYQLHVRFVNNDAPFSVDAKGNVYIAEYLRDFPYQAGAALSFGIAQHFVEHRHHTVISAELLEQATITFGFGLLVLNGLETNSTWAEKIHQLRQGHWQIHNCNLLSTRSEASYASAVQAYISNFQLASADFIPLLNAPARQLLPGTNKNAETRLDNPKLPEILISHQQAAKEHWIKLGLVALAFTIICCLVFFLLAQRQAKPSKDVVSRYNAIMKLRQNYDACESQAEQQQNSLDVNNDIFMQQQVDSTLSHCDSLRNEYNYAVQQYNQVVNK